MAYTHDDIDKNIYITPGITLKKEEEEQTLRQLTFKTGNTVIKLASFFIFKLP